MLPSFACSATGVNSTGGYCIHFFCNKRRNNWGLLESILVNHRYNIVLCSINCLIRLQLSRTYIVSHRTLYSSNTDKLLMGFQLRLLGLCLCLALTLSLCHGNNVTVKVIAVIHCTDCITKQNQTNSDINISIHCKSKNQETKTLANGLVDKEGNFNVTLSADDKSIDDCFAELQSASPNPCPIHSAQTTSLKLISIQENAAEEQTKPTVIKFSPITCQSAFFQPFPNITFFPFLSPPSQRPPAEYSPPPTEALTPLSPPVQPPALAPQLPYSPPVSPPSQEPIRSVAPAPQVLNRSPPVLPDPILSPTSPPPQAFHQTPSGLPLPCQSPPSPPTHAFHRMPSVLPTPSLSPTSPPTQAVHRMPSVLPTPSLSPTSPPTQAVHRMPSVPPMPSLSPTSPPTQAIHRKRSALPTPSLSPSSPPTQAVHRKRSALPTPSLSPSSPPPQAFHQTPSVPPSSVLPRRPPAPVSAPAIPPALDNPISNPPKVRKPSPIPRAPPVPNLPPLPTVPRKYFNSPKSRTQPPRSSDPSHS